MRITGPLARAASRRDRRDRPWDDERFRQAREHDLAQPLTSIRSVLVATGICLVMATLLTTDKLVEIAGRQPLGESRDRWLALAERKTRTVKWRVAHSSGGREQVAPEWNPPLPDRVPPVSV